jgi:hypothetical protein
MNRINFEVSYMLPSQINKKDELKQLAHKQIDYHLFHNSVKNKIKKATFHDNNNIIPSEGIIIFNNN